MGAIAERLKADYAELSKTARKPLEIPEFGLTVWISPWTWGQAMEVEPYQDSLELLRAVIRVKSKLENGQPAFDADDMSAMKSHADPGLIKRIGQGILALYPLSFDEKKT